MSKNIEIAYQDFKGLHVQAPENKIPPEYSPASQNFWTRNNELRSRPVFRQRLPPPLPGPVPSNAVFGVGSFFDATGQLHTIAWNPGADFSEDMWQLSTSNTWEPIAYSGFSAILETLPIQWRVFAGSVYFTNGSFGVGVWSGTTGEWSPLNTTVTQTAAAVASTTIGAGGTGYAVGDTGVILGGNANATYQVSTESGGAVTAYTITNGGSGYSAGTTGTSPGGAQPGSGSGFTLDVTAVSGSYVGSVGGFYIGESNNSLLLANTVENVAANSTVSFPNRIRWSANGVPNIWDPTVNTSAGSNDFMDVPDAITGLMSMGAGVVFIFRTNGITEQTVNGAGILPFTWNHLWGEQHGIGNVYPGTIDTYGSVGFFVDFENVYQVSVYSFEPVGGFARDAIFADLANATGQPLGGIVDQWINGFVYLTYNLCIPMNGGTKIWIYSLEDKTWQNFFVGGFTITAKPFRVWID